MQYYKCSFEIFNQKPNKNYCSLFKIFVSNFLLNYTTTYFKTNIKQQVYNAVFNVKNKKLQNK